jgi:DNA modification methylase
VIANSDQWPAFNVERHQASALKPYKNNARTHSDEQVAQIAASIREWGWTQPILIDPKGGVIAGHGRLLAAQSLGVDEVPVIIARGWSKDQIKAYVLADNQLALNAGWDQDLLRVEIGALGAAGFDTELLGFGADALADLFSDKTDGLTDPDDVPELAVNPVSRSGDLWILGPHRLLCGDATVATDVESLLGSVKPLLMVTDPPYGVEYDPAWRNKAGATATRRIGKVLNDDRADWRKAWALFPGDVAYVWHGALHAATVADSLDAAGFDVRSQIIWAKDRLVLSRGDYHWQHEPCWYAVRKTGKGHWAGDRKQTTLWQISNRDQDAETVHGTQKPVECMQRPIENNSSPGQTVYEPFSGSGTTIIAAEMTGRACHAIELSPIYVDVAVQRWQGFTGRQATLEGDGRSFEGMKAERYDAAKDSADSYGVWVDHKRAGIEARERASNE